MAKCLLSTTNLVDAAGSTLSVDSEITTLPATNLRDASPQVVARAASTSWQIDVDFGAASDVGVVALGGLNLGAADTIRCRLSAVGAGGGELHDTTALACGVLAAYGTWVDVLPATVSARWLRLNLVASAPLTYAEAGRLWAGPVFQPTRNWDWGLVRRTADLSQVRQAARSGRRFSDTGPRQRSIAFTLSALTSAEARATVADIAMAVGSSAQVLFVPDPDSSAPNAGTMPRETYLGVMADQHEVAHRAFPIHAWPLRIVEDL